MNIPTWKVTVYAEMWSKGTSWMRNPIRHVTVEAYTGPAAEEAALADYPNWTVVRCERLTGFEPTDAAHPKGMSRRAAELLVADVQLEHQRRAMREREKANRHHAWHSASVI